MPESDELLDLVDQNDNVIGTIWRSQTADLHKQSHGFLRAAEVLLLNKNGELWIPRRGINKEYAPADTLPAVDLTNKRRLEKRMKS